MKSLAAITERAAIKKKMQVIDELNKLVDEHDTVAIAHLFKVRAPQIQQLSQKFRGDMRMRVVKNTLIMRAQSKNKRPNVNKLAEHLKGSNVLLFTNTDAFKLTILLNKNKTQMTAKAGDIAPNDIVIPAGNTGLPPGPAISELHDVGARTRIDMGSVWVIEDAVVVKRGEIVQAKVAGVLSKMNVKPLEIGLELVAAYESGSVFGSEDFQFKVDDYVKQLEGAASQALNLAVNAVYPTDVTIKINLQQAYLKAKNLAINSNYVAPEVAREIITKAHSQASALAAKVSEIIKSAAPS